MSEARGPSAAARAVAAEEIKSDAHTVLGTAARTVSNGARAAGHYTVARPIAEHHLTQQARTIQDIASLAQQENGGLDGPDILRLHTGKETITLSGDQQSIAHGLARDSRLGLNPKTVDNVYGEYAGRLAGAREDRHGRDLTARLQETTADRALAHDYRLHGLADDQIASRTSYMGRLAGAGLRGNIRKGRKLAGRYLTGSIRLAATGDEDMASAEQGAEQFARTPGRLGRFARHAGRTVARPGKMFAATRTLRARSRLLRAAARKGAATGKLSLHEVHRLMWLAVRNDIHNAALIVGGSVSVIIIILFLVSVLTPVLAAVHSSANQCDQSTGSVAAATVGASDGVLEGSKIRGKQGNLETLDYHAMNIDNTPYGGNSGYEFQQCTWWVARRLETLGIKVPAHLGNGQQWGEALSHQPGWSIVPPGSPIRLGDVVSIHGGALGSTPGFGHVAIVEKTSKGADDHGLWLSEAGTKCFKRYGAPILDNHGNQNFHNLWIKGDIVIVRPPAAGQGTSAPGSVTDPALASDCVANPDSDDPNLPGAKEASKGQIHDEQEYALSLFGQYGWNTDRNGSDFKSLLKLFTRESGWNPTAKNASSGAFGIPQSLPASKMASEGADWATNWKTQIRWGLKYIKGRYKTPTQAWNHEIAKGWY